MAGRAIRMLFETVRTIPAATIAVGYMGVGTSLDHPARQFLIQNLTDQTVMFSFDGVNDHFPLPSNGFFLNDISSNKSVTEAFFLAQGDRLYVKQLAVPTTGFIYFSVIYGKET